MILGNFLTLAYELHHVEEVLVVITTAARDLDLFEKERPEINTKLLILISDFLHSG